MTDLWVNDTCIITLTGVEGVTGVSWIKSSSAESVDESTFLARADLRGETATLGELGAVSLGEVGTDPSGSGVGVDTLVIEPDLKIKKWSNMHDAYGKKLPVLPIEI